MKKRILFVDDDPGILDGLRRMLHPLRAEWEMSFVENGADALDLLSKGAFDAIISDMRMPGMNGAELLAQVMKLHPGTIRFILSGYSDQQLILKTVGSAHQYLSKPCDTTTLKTALERAFSLRALLADPALESLAVRLDSLPSLPRVHLELLEELQSPDASIQEIGKLISKDIGMTAKILQLVNSAFFGLPQHVSSPAQAASLLGLDIIRGMMLSVHVFSEFRPEGTLRFSAEALWSHSITVAAFAKKIAEIENAEPRVISDSLTAGMLHDAGKLLFAANMPGEFGKALAKSQGEGIPLHVAERDLFDTSHAEVGAYLMGLWAFPDHVVEALALHHEPEKGTADAFSPLTAVHAADVIGHELRPTGGSATTGRISAGYLEKLGLSENLPRWREACAEILEGEGVEDEIQNPVR